MKIILLVQLKTGNTGIVFLSVKTQYELVKFVVFCK